MLLLLSLSRDEWQRMKNAMRYKRVCYLSIYVPVYLDNRIRYFLDSVNPRFTLCGNLSVVNSIC
jgi:hypothetical protein